MAIPKGADMEAKLDRYFKQFGPEPPILVLLPARQLSILARRNRSLTEYLLANNDDDISSLYSTINRKQLALLKVNGDEHAKAELARREERRAARAQSKSADEEAR